MSKPDPFGSRRPMPEALRERLIGFILTRLPDAVAVYRFGSWGSVYERPASDIDLAVLPAAPLAPLTRWELAQELAALLYRDVDLVDLLQASTVLRLQLIAHGERLYCADADACAVFEDYVYAAYARLNEERRAILEDIRKRGSVYGR